MNPWVIAQVNGKWYAGTYEWLRPGQADALIETHRRKKSE